MSVANTQVGRIRFNASGGFRWKAGGSLPLSKPGSGSHQHGLWPCAVAMRPFVPSRSNRLSFLKILDPPLLIAATAPHSSDSLNAVPWSAVGTRLDDTSLSGCGPTYTSHDRCRPIFRSCVSSVKFAVHCPDPWSSRWLRLLFLVLWTTEVRHLQASPNTFFGSSSLLWMQQLDSSTRRLGVATSLRFFVNSTGRKQRSGLTSSSLFLYTNVYTGLRRHTLPMNLVDLVIRRPGADFDRGHRHDIIISRPSHSRKTVRKSNQFGLNGNIKNVKVSFFVCFVMRCKNVFNMPRIIRVNGIRVPRKRNYSPIAPRQKLFKIYLRN